MFAQLQENPDGRSENVRSEENRSIPRWASVIVILGALLMAAGAIIALVHPAMMVSPGADINVAARVYAGYLVSRNLAIAMMLLVLLALRARAVLGGFMVLTGLIQVLDIGMDAVEGRWGLIPGILVFALVFLMGASRVAGRPFWKVSAWRTVTE